MSPTPAAANDAEMPARAIVARVWSQYLKPQKIALSFAVVCAVGVAATTALFAWFLDPSINLLFHMPEDSNTRLLPDAVKLHAMIAVPAIIIVTALLRFAAQRGMTKTLNRIGNTLVGRIQSQLFSRLVHADLGRLQQAHSGQYVSSVLYDADQVRDAASTGMVQYVQAGLTVAGTLITMFLMDWTMTLIVLLIGPVIAQVMQRYLKLTRKAAQGAMTETSSLSTAVMESLDGVKIIKISNRETAEEARVDDLINRRQTHLIKGSNARSMAAPATEVLTGFLVAGLLAYAGWRAHTGHLTASMLIGFIGAFMTASQNLRQLAGLQGTFSQGMTAARRLFAALDIEPEITEAAGAKTLSRDFKAVTFNHAGFGYSATAPVLKDVSFTARAGETIALVGPSGSGKST
ncbi:MAG: ABC transporter transmembrane domain-containing protein, partial [Asticcacaulis sp.]